MNTTERIVRDVRERRDSALWEWSLRLDDAEPVRAESADGLPTESLLALADAVRRWHELQRPPDVCLEIAPGVELVRRWVPLR
jgi:histidinol dehydrogenase